MAKKLTKEELQLKEQEELEEYQRSLPLEILKLIVEASKENIELTYSDDPITVNFWHSKHWNDEGESISLSSEYVSDLDNVKMLVEFVKEKRIEAEIKQQKFEEAKSKLTEFKESLTKEELKLLKGFI